MATIELRKGQYGNKDNVIYVNSDPLTLLEIANLLILIRDNESYGRKGNGWQNQHGDLLFKKMLHKINYGISLEKLKPFLVSGFKRKDFDKADFDHTEWDKVFCDTCGKQTFCDGCNKYIWRRKKDGI